MIGKSNISFRWDARFLDMAKLVASWSKDPSTKVGAVIANDSHHVVSVGFNGFPAGLADSYERLLDRERKLALTIHAEHNAILFSDRSLVGCNLYVYPLQPCVRCAVTIVQSGISRVVYPKHELNGGERWAADFKLAREVFDEAKVMLECLNLT